MMFRRFVPSHVLRAVLLISMIVGVPIPTFALGDVAVSWPDIAKLVDTHPQLAAARFKTDAAYAAVDAAGAIPNPSLELGLSEGEALDGSISRGEWGVGLSIPLSWIAERGPLMDVADAEVVAVDAESKALRRDVLLQLRSLFWRLVYEQERVAVLSELNAQTEVWVRSVQQRVEKGEIRPVEATRVEVEAERVAGELELAQAALHMRQAQLGLWLGARGGETILAMANLSELPSFVTEELAREQVKTMHPGIVASKARVDALSAQTSLEYRMRVPQVSLEAFAEHELDRRAYGVGLAIELPVWNWNGGKIRESESLLAAQKKELEAERFELETSVIEVHGQCQAGVALAIRHRDRILPRAILAAQTIERTYSLGEASLLEVIDARRTLLETRRVFLGALVQAQTDCARLSALAGEELK